ncbi:hypothetical protein HanPI659440_Chr09g0316531 [Helianthus annuus]|nr:hypothetical protein HanPI659440_Chr09g0316531 [Helianthus annuus]
MEFYPSLYKTCFQFISIQNIKYQYLSKFVNKSSMNMILFLTFLKRKLYSLFLPKICRTRFYQRLLF